MTFNRRIALLSAIGFAAAHASSDRVLTFSDVPAPDFYTPSGGGSASTRTPRPKGCGAKAAKRAAKKRRNVRARSRK